MGCTLQQTGPAMDGKGFGIKASFLFREGAEFRERLGQRKEEWDWDRQPDSAAGRKEGAAFPEDLPR